MADERLGRFGHHPNPAIDFEIEVQSLQDETWNLNHGFMNGTPSREEIAARIERAMDFRVGGDLGAIAAKQALRELSKAGA